jgi:Uncharacterized conserved protein
MNLFRWSIVGLLCFGVIGVGLSTGIVEFDQGQSFEYESATVTAVDNESRELATVDVRIADTDSKRYLGLSDTESLGADEGMLFVYETQQEPTFVMRDMSFPIDIVLLVVMGPLLLFTTLKPMMILCLREQLSMF